MRAPVVISDEREWLRLLGDGRCTTVEATLANFPGYYSRPARSDMGSYTLSENLIYLFVAGGACATLPEGEETIATGSLCVLPAARTFRLRTLDSIVRLYRCRFRVRRGRDELVWLGRAHLQPHAQDLQATLVALIDEAQSPRPFGEERTRWLLCLLFSGLFRLGGDARDGEPGLSQAQRSHLQRYAHDRMAYSPEPRELAVELGLSLDYFTRIFRRSFGIPPRAWLLQERIRLAAVRVVESNDAIAAIARDFGYADPNLFGRQFRRVMGRTPSAFRVRHDQDRVRSRGRR